MNKEKYVLQEVTTPALVREWLDLPKRIYKGNRNWVCPLDQDVEEVFDPARNEPVRRRRGDPLGGARRPRRGRGPHRGFLQPREGGPRRAAHGRLRLLLSRSTTGRRPICSSTPRACGSPAAAWRRWTARSTSGSGATGGACWSRGYEFQPLYKNPYNPPYYKELFEGYGFRNYFNQNSYIWRVNASEANKSIFARAGRLDASYHVENIDMNNLEEAAENFRVIYNKAWALFSGVKPMTREEALEMVREMEADHRPADHLLRLFQRGADRVLHHRAGPEPPDRQV